MRYESRCARTRFSLTSAIFALTLTTLSTAHARADDITPRPYLDIPISQAVIRDGVIRYFVWVKVGERTVQAMVDTGSTGLRVLQSVFPGPLSGRPTDIGFGAGLHMAGWAIRTPIQIGSLIGIANVEVVTDIGCSPGRPNCDVNSLGGDDYLIGGDGFPAEGYSAIIGIGFPFRGTDLGNPLSAIGVKRWIVELPRPYETADGHLILDPSASAASGFSMLSRHGSADGAGCITGGPLTETKCGTILFDTGAPAITLSDETVVSETQWPNGTQGALSFIAGDDTLKLDFEVGKSDALNHIGLTPLEPHDALEPFILAGVYPFYTYDILYDADAHAVGLRKRPSLTQPGLAGR